MKKQILSLLLTVCLMLNMLPDMAFADAALTITYNANGGSGSMAEDTTTEGMITLPDCTFTPPEGKQFQCWAIGSTEGTQSEVGETYTFTNDTTVYAVWEDTLDTLSITTTTLPDGTVGSAYSQTLTASGSAITWSLAVGSLPAGLALDASTGEIKGSPTTEGSSTFTIKASNGTDPDVTREFTIKVASSGGTGVVGITNWADLKDAISKASTTENTIITIGADFSTSSESWDPISIKKDVHIILQSAAGHNFTIIRADGSQGSFFFMINGNSSLTLQNITLDGGGENLSKAPNSSLIYVSNTGDNASLIIDSGAVLKNNHIQNSNGGAIFASSAIITMNSGSLIQNNSTNTTGGGICLLNATLTMNGGIIENNTVTGVGGSSGGGVAVLSNGGSSVFNMNGGSITGNTAFKGGGVNVSGGDSSVFHLSGGAITDNIATGYSGGGVYLSGPSFRSDNTETNAALMNIKGNPVISGNKSGAVESSRVASDLYIQDIDTGRTTKAATLKKSGEFVAGASVGINLQYGYNPNVLISDGTNTVTEGDASLFFSNNASKTIKYDSVLAALVVGDSGVSAPFIITASLPDGTAGTAYSKTLAAVGTTPITWSVISGSLPDGLILNSATGVISGTPTAAVTSTFTVQASNGLTPVATKVLSITIAKAVATVWDGTSAQYFDGGTGISSNPYQIRTAEQLALLTDVINGKIDKKVVEAQAVQPYATLQEAYYKLTADIKLNDTTNVAQWETTAPSNTWGVIGRLDYFKGVFDGDNYTVSGLYYNSSSAGNVGLFGTNRGIIKNINVKDGYVNGLSAVGSIAAENQGTIDNCHNTVNVAAQYSTGGIVGNNDRGIIKNCTNAGEVTNREGQFGGTYAGGITAISGGVGSLIENCTNSGKIVGFYMIGGIVGRVGVSTVKNCTNTGTVTGTVTETVSNAIGGIAGAEYPDAIIDTCINTGIIRGDNMVGGIVGWNQRGTIKSVFSPKGVTIGATTDIGLPNSNYLGHIVGATESSYSGSSDSYGGITVSPASTTVAQGATNAFSANGMQTGNTVEWSVGGGISGTSIDANGMLKVADNETDASLAVIAVVKTNGVVTGVGTATVTITKTPKVTEITVTPASATVKRSKTQQFSASVNGVNNPVQTVTWSIVETVQTGTSIDENGLLTVAVGETANSLTIKATSTADNTKSATASVALTDKYGNVWDDTSAQYFNGGTGTVDDPYQIATAEQLTLLAGVINQLTYGANNTFNSYGSGNRKVVADQDAKTYTYLESASYILTADIILNDTSNVVNWATTAPSNTWNMIGDATHYFKGVFNGASHTISGLFYSNSNSYGVGLFKTNKGTIKNLYLIEGYIKALGYAGSLVGYGNYGTIDNCHNYISVSANDNAGGLADCNYSNGTIKNSSNAGTVQSSGSASGGIASLNHYSSVIENCTNTGTITGKERAGGIVGNALSANSTKSAINNCTNTGTVTGTKWVGGIAGKVYSDLEESTVNNCINTGTINGTNRVGGITGDLFGAMTNVFSPKGVTVGATSDIGTAEPYYGHIIGYKLNGNYSGGSNSYGSITISPASTSVEKGVPTTFKVNSTQSGDTVEWSVAGGINGTTISSEGILTVANSETAASLTVTAIVKSNGKVTGAGTANVTIITPPTVTGVTISPASAVIIKNKTQQFTAKVAGDNSPSQEVEWKVTGGVSGTTISATGLLAVAADETATELTVTATSIEDNTKSAIVTVTVAIPSGTVWDGTSAQYFDGGEGTADKPYLIRTAEQLALLVVVINKSNYSLGNREVVAGRG